MKKSLKTTYTLLAFLVSPINTYAIERTQEIELKKGWNAIYLEVDPVIKQQNLSSFMMPKGDDNNTIATPISIIATYYPKFSSVEYIEDPSSTGWKKATWKRWIRDDLPESFLTNLFDLEINQSYLVKADKSFTWRIKGEVLDVKRRWQPNSFNLTGFNVRNPAPSFYQYFQNNNAAKAFANGPIYSLNNGKWEKINMLDTAVEQNKAYWVYADNTPEFQGVLDVQVQGDSNTLSFLDIVNRKTLELKNSSSSPISVTVSLEDNAVPLSLLEQNDLAQNTYTPVSNHVKTLTVGANEQQNITLAVRRNEISGTQEQEGLLKFSVSGVNEVYYIPISAYGGN